MGDNPKKKGPQEKLGHCTNIQKSTNKAQLQAIKVGQVKMDLKLKIDCKSQGSHQQENQINQQDKNLKQGQVGQLNHQIHAINKNCFD